MDQTRQLYSRPTSARTMARRHAAKSALAATVVILLLAVPAAAYDEAEAAQVRLAETGRDDVVAVWHEPAIVQPGTQWHGFIRFAPEANVTLVLFQLCRVGYNCFAPPTPAQRLDDATWGFDTQDYIPPGSDRPIDWKAGWRVGVQFVLNQSTPDGPMQTVFPNATEDPGDIENHYISFNMPAPKKTTPSPGPGVFVLVLAAATLLRRRGS